MKKKATTVSLFFYYIFLHMYDIFSTFARFLCGVL